MLCVSGSFFSLKGLGTRLLLDKNDQRKILSLKVRCWKDVNGRVSYTSWMTMRFRSAGVTTNVMNLGRSLEDKLKRRIKKSSS